jgi:ribonuclease R
MERRLVKGVTIDSEQTRDIDDAIWIEFGPDGFWHIFVSIADVDDAVPPGGKMDTRAREMVTTKYFGTGNSPMLPRVFSEDQLSLWPGKERKTITVDMAVMPNGEGPVVRKLEIYPSILTSQARCTYERIPAILADKEHEGHDLVSIGCKMAMGLLDRRRKAGAMVLYDLNNGWMTTEEGFLRKIEKKEETIGYIMVQELMVLANAQVAEWAVKNDIPILFRNHVAMSAMPDRQVLMAQIQDALTTPFADLETVRQRTHMLLGRANYSDSLLGHYGLNLAAYTHFTSPIRRYADLVTHRQIAAFLEGKPFPYTKKDVEEIALHINDTLELEREKAAMHFKTADERRAQQNIDARRLDGLDAVHFERVTKVEARSGTDPSEGFAETFLRRLKENRLPLIALTVIVTQDGLTPAWQPIQQAIVDALAKRPEDAVSLLAMAHGVAEWPLADYEGSHEGPDHMRVFTCKATISLPVRETGEGFPATETHAGLGKGTTAKLAKYHAAIDLIAQLCGAKVPEKLTKIKGLEPYVAKEHEVVRLAIALPDKYLVVGSTGSVVHVYPDAYEVEFITDKGHEVLTLSRDSVMPLSAPVPVENTLDGKVAALKSDLSKDPVSALMEYVAKVKTAPPLFVFDKTGPDHIPTITCTVKMGVIEKTASAPSKQEAKKKAAGAVLEALRSV